MQITTVGLDIAKRVFQVHGADASGKTVLRRKLQEGGGADVLRSVTAMPDWHRSVQHGTSLGTRSHWRFGHKVRWMRASVG